MNKIFLSFALILIPLLWSCNSSKVVSSEPTNSNEIDFTKNYEIYSKEFGTKTTMTITDKYRILTTNSLPNHRTGNFPNPGNPNTISEQNTTYKLPIHPVFTGKANWVREFGVAVNGIKFEPETAERFECETGEVYKIEAKQDLIDLGLDLNNAHVQPNGAYHYHGVPLELIVMLDKGEDLILLGYAKDGFPLYYSKSSAYKTSFKLKKQQRVGEVCEYKNPKQSVTKDLQNTTPDGIFVSDWEYIEGLGDLDECNGMMLNGEYVYFATMSYPYVGRCLKGDFTENNPIGPAPRKNGMNNKPPRGNKPSLGGRN